MSNNKEIQVELTQEQFSFLEDFGRKCENPASSDISKASVLRCLPRLFREVEVDVRGVQTEDELLHRLLNASKRESHRQVILL